MGRIAAIDFGETRIGIALSDISQIIASPLKMLLAKNTLKETARLIFDELQLHEPLEKIVLGLPLHLNGKESPISLKVRELKVYLEELFTIPIVLWDERLTTAQVERTLIEAKVKRKNRTNKVDAMAASILLSSFLENGLASNASTCFHKDEKF